MGSSMTPSSKLGDLATGQLRHTQGNAHQFAKHQQEFLLVQLLPCAQTIDENQRVGQLQTVQGLTVCKVRTARYENMQGVHASPVCLMPHQVSDPADVRQGQDRQKMQLLMQGEYCRASPCG